MRYTNAMMYPGPGGAHSFMPQAYSDVLGTLYIPTIRSGAPAFAGPADPSKWRHRDGYMSFGYEGEIDPPADAAPSSWSPPAKPAPEPVPDANTTSVLAWDPVAAREKWRIRTPGFWNGGLLVTDGNLLFQGLGNGEFLAYDARDGRTLWNFNAKMGISGAPITYEVDGRQYVSVVAGWGATGAAFAGAANAPLGWQMRVHPQRIVTFALDGKAQLPANIPAPVRAVPIDDPALVIEEARASRGGRIFERSCAACHGGGAIAGGYAPDLRASPVTLSAEAFRGIVQQGSLETLGMPKYDELSDEDTEQLRFYVRKMARQALSDRGR
jgi:quinohemoprotein ethanol dehydrogenase